MDGGSLAAASIGTLTAKGYKDAGVQIAGTLKGTFTFSGAGVKSNKNTVTTLKADRLEGRLEVEGSVGTLAAKIMENAEVFVSGSVKKLKTDSIIVTPFPPPPPPPWVI